MGIIKSIRIVGFKKFKNFEMDFNEGMNILVGENEAGKSTILEAIEIVLNQKYKTTEKAALQELFNVENISEFDVRRRQEVVQIRRQKVAQTPFQGV